MHGNWIFFERIFNNCFLWFARASSLQALGGIRNENGYMYMYTWDSCLIFCRCFTGGKRGRIKIFHATRWTRFGSSQRTNESHVWIGEAAVYAGDKGPGLLFLACCQHWLELTLYHNVISNLTINFCSLKVSYGHWTCKFKGFCCCCLKFTKHLDLCFDK